MKLLATFGLAAVTLASADVFQQLEDLIVGQIFNETADGFEIKLEPYYHGIFSESSTFSNQMIIQTIKYSDEFNFRGDESKNCEHDYIMTMETVSTGVEFTLGMSGLEYYSEYHPFYSIMPIREKWSDNRQFSKLNFQHGINVVQDLNGLQISIVNSVSNDDGAATMKISTDIEVSGAVDRTDITLFAEVDHDLKLGGSWSPTFAADNNIIEGGMNFDMEVNFDQDSCSKYFELTGKACVISLDSNWERSLPQISTSGSFATEVKFLKAMVVLKISVDDKNYYMVTRSESPAGKIELLTAQRFTATYYTQDDDFRGAINNGEATLLIRVPGATTWEKKLWPELEAKWAPFSVFFDKLGDVESIPYLVYNFDHFVNTFDTELDCSKFVKLGMWNSDLADQHLAKRDSTGKIIEVTFDLNQWIQDQCVAFNDAIVDKVQSCQQLQDGVDSLQAYVKNLTSKKGFKEYKTMYGKIF